MIIIISFAVLLLGFMLMFFSNYNIEDDIFAFIGLLLVVASLFVGFLMCGLLVPVGSKPVEAVITKTPSALICEKDGEFLAMSSEVRIYNANTNDIVVMQELNSYGMNIGYEITIDKGLVEGKD